MRQFAERHIMLGLVSILLGAPISALADPEPASTLVTGLWHTVSDADGKPRGIVEVFQDANGVYSGKIVGSLRGESADAVCAKCSGERKGKPLLGMLIFSGLRWDGKGYSGGEILDPDNGKTYRCLIRVEDGGQKLNVRGYIGIPTIGRSQFWVRPKP